jgi:hypothetical protein
MSLKLCLTSIEPVRSALTANALNERAKHRVQDHARHAEHQKADKQFHWFSPFTKCMTFASGAQDG